MIVPTLAGGALAGMDPVAKYDERLRDALLDDPASVSVIVLTDGAPAPIAEQARLLGGSVTWEYTIVDGFAATLAPVALHALAARADVTRVELDNVMAPKMTVSAPAIEADRVWASGYDGSGITVAVIDTGIERTHPFFEDAVIGCVSTIAGLVTPECTDSDGHGTHVAGTVASRDDVYRGIAPGANLVAVRVLHAVGSGVSSDVIAGIEWVREHRNEFDPPIRVATMSVGSASPVCDDGTSAQAQAANALVLSGVVFTVSAGNSGHEECTIDGASSAVHTITVGSVNDQGTVTQSDDVIAPSSSGGPTLDGRIKPDIAFPGVRITSAFIGGGVFIATMSGTSMATPHAAGTAALLLEKEPRLDPQDVKDRILGTAVTNAHTGTVPNAVYGHGLGNSCLALKLKSCGEDNPRPVRVHIADLEITGDHFGQTGHRVATTALVLDAHGSPIRGATVTVEITAPDATATTRSDRTDALGTAAAEARSTSAGHGEWSVCVTDVAGTNIIYDAAENVETCDTLAFAH